MRVTMAFVMATTTTALGCDTVDDQDRRIGSDVLIASEVSCPSCSIVFDTVVTLKNVFFTGPSTAIARDSTTDVFYVVDRADGLLKAFASDGRLLRSVGTAEGPANTRWPVTYSLRAMARSRS